MQFKHVVVVVACAVVASWALEEGEKSHVVHISVDSFSEVALDTTKHVLVKFYSTWCGHCKSLAPTYELVAEALTREPDVVLSEINIEENPEKAHRLMKQYKVHAVPTLLWFPKNDKSGVMVFKGKREPENFFRFFKEMLGINRVAGGDLAEDAGTDATMNELALAYASASENERADAKKAIVDGAKDLGEIGTRYIEAVNKIEAKGASFPQEEVRRLNELLSHKRSLSVEKRDKMVLRRNVLRAFRKE